MPDLQLAVYCFRQGSLRPERHPRDGAFVNPVEAHRLICTLSSRFYASECIAVCLHPPGTFNASDVARIAKEQQMPESTPKAP